MLCEHCNRLISLTDTICPYCGQSLSSSHKDNSDASEDISSDIETVIPSNDIPVSDSDAGVSSEISDTASTEMVVNESDGSEDTSDNISDNIDDISNTEETNRKSLENNVSSGTREKNTNVASRFLIALAILSVLALFSSIVLFILLPKQQQIKQDTEIISFMEGAWISDYFAFYDSVNKNYVEVLTVDKEGNFTMMYTVPDEEYPDGWSTGKWKIIEQIEGTLAYIKQENRLLLLYELDGVKGCFERFFISKEQEIICLREYYDETNDNYYDVILHRIKLK